MIAKTLFLSLTVVSLFQVKVVLSRFSKCCVSRRTHHLAHFCSIFLALIYTNTPKAISEIDLNPTTQHLSLNQLLRDACCILAGMLLLRHPQKAFPVKAAYQLSNDYWVIWNILIISDIVWHYIKDI